MYVLYILQTLFCSHECKSTELKKYLSRSHTLLIKINFNIILQSSPRDVSRALDF